MLLRFADYELDVEERKLHRAVRLIDVDPKAFDLPVLLAQQADQLVPRDAIVAALWPDVVVATPRSANACAAPVSRSPIVIAPRG